MAGANGIMDNINLATDPELAEAIQMLAEEMSPPRNDRHNG